MNLKKLGWNNTLQQEFEAIGSTELIPGRVALEHKRIYRVLTEQGELLSEVTGKLRHSATSREDYPAVGDWVLLSPRVSEGKATIHRVLPRFSKFSRKVAGNTLEEQIVATNINTVFIVSALNQDLNVRRIERYLLQAWESGANPVIVLTKADLSKDINGAIQLVESVAYGVPIHVTSVRSELGCETLHPYMTEGKTVALIGSSGVGKSSLTNYLLGANRMEVRDIREDDGKGKHTTTYRELLPLPHGGVIIDTPGMRELQLWDSEGALFNSFVDIEELAGQCYYRDCKHMKEPHCAVQEAIQQGSLDQPRFQSFLKLQKELAHLERKNDLRAQLAEKEKWKKLSGDRTRINRK